MVGVVPLSANCMDRARARPIQHVIHRRERLLPARVERGRAVLDHFRAATAQRKAQQLEVRHAADHARAVDEHVGMPTGDREPIRPRDGRGQRGRGSVAELHGLQRAVVLVVAERVARAVFDPIHGGCRPSPSR